MLVSVHSFGSIWSHRLGKSLADPRRFTSHAAFYNTTGVEDGGKLRHRSCVYGYARFDGAGRFDPHRISRMIHRVFECDEPCMWNGANKVRFRRLLPRAARPDRFLVTVTSDRTGTLDKHGAWSSDDSHLISFSECGDQQEAMLLMPAYGWVRGAIGTFCLEPLAARPWACELNLVR